MTLRELISEWRLEASATTDGVKKHVLNKCADTLEDWIAAHDWNDETGLVTLSDPDKPPYRVDEAGRLVIDVEVKSHDTS